MSTGKGMLLVLGDRNMGTEDFDLIKRYLPDSVYSGVNFVDVTNQQWYDLYDDVGGRMSHVSHVLVACLTSVVAEPSGYFSTDREESIRMSVRFVLTKLNVWKMVNPHLTMCIVPPLERFSLDFNYQRHYEIFEEEYVHWNGRNNARVKLLRPVSIHAKMYTADGRTLKRVPRFYYVTNIFMNCKELYMQQ